MGRQWQTGAGKPKEGPLYDDEIRVTVLGEQSPVPGLRWSPGPLLANGTPEPPPDTEWGCSGRRAWECTF